jgi:hypothetical protein
MNAVFIACAVACVVIAYLGRDEWPLPWLALAAAATITIAAVTL